MKIIAFLLALVSRLNDVLLAIGRRVAIVAMVLMVCVILLQIFFRYVLNNALPWPEEAARGLMIWMMAMVVPTAYRYSGFVSIEMIPDMLPAKLRSLLLFTILLLCTLVLVVMLNQAWSHFSAPLLFDSSGLNRLLQESGINELLGTDMQFKTAYIYLAMSVMLVVMLLVSAELILRHAARLIWSAEDFPMPVRPGFMGGSS